MPALAGLTAGVVEGQLGSFDTSGRHQLVGRRGGDGPSSRATDRSESPSRRKCLAVSSVETSAPFGSGGGQKNHLALSHTQH